jgi:hypothetical protein
MGHSFPGAEGEAVARVFLADAEDVGDGCCAGGVGVDVAEAVLERGRSNGRRRDTDSGEATLLGLGLFSGGGRG